MLTREHNWAWKYLASILPLFDVYFSLVARKAIFPVLANFLFPRPLLEKEIYVYTRTSSPRYPTQPSTYLIAWENQVQQTKKPTRYVCVSDVIELLPVWPRRHTNQKPKKKLEWVDAGSFGSIWWNSLWFKDTYSCVKLHNNVEFFFGVHCVSSCQVHMFNFTTISFLEYFWYFRTFCFFCLPFLPSFWGRDSMKKQRFAKSAYNWIPVYSIVGRIHSPVDVTFFEGVMRTSGHVKWKRSV